jgi:hypothetical protein
MAKAPKQEEMPIEGPGVAPVKDRKLDNLCDSLLEDRDSKAALAEKMTATEAKILDRMAELLITVHRFGDQLATIKVGKNHVKIKTIKTGDDNEAPGED